jgi:hypothetical protein
LKDIDNDRLRPSQHPLKLIKSNKDIQEIYFMSLVIVTKNNEPIEQFVKFLKHIDTTIASHNAALTSENAPAGQKSIDQSAFTSRARELLKAVDLNGLIEHILTLGDFLIQEPKGIV